MNDKKLRKTHSELSRVQHIAKEMNINNRKDYFHRDCLLTAYKVHLSSSHPYLQ
jgi:hypothetical protein